jgi:hypothetical protein
VTIEIPLAKLIQTRMQALGLDRQALGFRLGYQNPLKAAGRVDALCSGQLTSPRSKAALSRLPDALDLPAEIVEQAVTATVEVLAEIERQAQEERRRAAEAEEAEWRQTFRPHAVIQTEHTVPTQIFFCGALGGARRFLVIPFDLSKPPLTFIQQAVAGLPEKHENGRRYVPFFGEALGFIVNYAPDQALRCDLDGEPLEVLPKAYRIGEVQLWIGKKRVEPEFMARLLGAL